MKTRFVFFGSKICPKVFDCVKIDGAWLLKLNSKVCCELGKLWNETATFWTNRYHITWYSTEWLYWRPLLHCTFCIAVHHVRTWCVCGQASSTRLALEVGNCFHLPLFCKLSAKRKTSSPPLGLNLLCLWIVIWTYTKKRKIDL